MTYKIVKFRATLSSGPPESGAQCLSPCVVSWPSFSLGFTLPQTFSLCTCRTAPAILDLGSASFLLKGLRVDIFSFAGHIFSVTTTPLCCDSIKAAVDSR